MGARQRRAAVLGRPIAHSLSPVLHLAAYRELGLTHWTYGAIECAAGEFSSFVETAGPEWVGLSLTMPLKRVAISVADVVSPLAQAVGAANTLVFNDGCRFVENTDVGGIVAALREAGVASTSGAVILGAGGTAQAALAALRELGDPTPTVLVRDASHTGDLRATADRLGVEPRIFDGLHGGVPVSGADLLISTIPSGAADALELSRFAGVRTVLDVVYDAWPTPLAAAAGRHGAQAVSGLAVLLHQAVGQVELMTGSAAPVEAMREALRVAVAARG